MLQVKKQVDVVCSAIGIKEAMTMLPITAWICSAIKDMIHHEGNVISIDLTPEQYIAIGKVLGEFGFVSETGENPLELIQKMESEKETPDQPGIEV